MRCFSFRWSRRTQRTVAPSPSAASSSALFASDTLSQSPSQSPSRHSPTELQPPAAVTQPLPPLRPTLLQPPPLQPPPLHPFPLQPPPLHAQLLQPPPLPATTAKQQSPLPPNAPPLHPPPLQPPPLPAGAQPSPSLQPPPFPSAAHPPPLGPRPPATLAPLNGTSAQWKTKQQQEERAEREKAQAAQAAQLAQLHAYSLHCFQVYAHGRGLGNGASGGGSGGGGEGARNGARSGGAVTGPPETAPDAADVHRLLGAARLAVLLHLKAGEANQRQVLCVTSLEEEQIVLKTCATDSMGEAYTEHMTGLIAQRLGLATPVVRMTRRVGPLLEVLTSLNSVGQVVALPSQSLQPSLWAPPQLASPYVYAMWAAKGKTLLELRPEERCRLSPHLLLPAFGRQAAFDALINNWDRWPLPTLWQKSREWLRLPEAELQAKCRPLRLVGSASVLEAERALLAADELLRGCGCNLGNVLIHPLMHIVTSIDTCIIGGAPVDYADKLAVMVDEVVGALDDGRADVPMRGMLAVLAAALCLDGPAGEEANLHLGDCGAAEQRALLQRGFVEGLVAAAEMAEADAFKALEARTLTDAELRGGDVPLPAPDEAIAKHLSDARRLVERNVAVCRARYSRLRQVLEKRGRAQFQVASPGVVVLANR